jgi:hypothetical protein
MRQSSVSCQTSRSVCFDGANSPALLEAILASQLTKIVVNVRVSGSCHGQRPAVLSSRDSVRMLSHHPPVPNRTRSSSTVANSLAAVWSERQDERCMFSLNEDEITSVRAAFDTGGEFAASVELRRLFPGITDLQKARQCVRIIAGWSRPASAIQKRVDPISSLRRQ